LLGQGLKKSPIGQKLDFANHPYLCGQSPAAIRALLSLGYPEHKLKYYRSGMNAWHSLGLSTVHNLK
jgi:rhodanese-related sulfurtransferase